MRACFSFFVKIRIFCLSFIKTGWDQWIKILSLFPKYQILYWIRIFKQNPRANRYARRGSGVGTARRTNGEVNGTSAKLAQEDHMGCSGARQLVSVCGGQLLGARWCQRQRENFATTAALGGCEEAARVLWNRVQKWRGGCLSSPESTVARGERDLRAESGSIPDVWVETARGGRRKGMERWLTGGAASLVRER